MFEFSDQSLLADDPVYLGLKLIYAEGFGDKIAGSGPDNIGIAMELGMAGDNNNLDQGIFLFDMLQEFHTVTPRHGQVGENQGKLTLLEPGFCLFAI